MYHWRLRVPNGTTNPLVPPWRGHGYSLWVGCTYVSDFSLPPAHTRTWPLLWHNVTHHKQTRFITEVTVPPKPKIPYFVRSPTHTAASPLTQTQSGTSGGTPRLIGESSSCADETPRSNDCAWPFESTVFLRGLWSESSNLHGSADSADQWLSHVANFFAEASLWHTLHTFHLSLRIAISR